MTTRKTTVFYGVLIAIASIAVGMVIASQWGLPQASSAQTINVPAANTAALNGPIDAQTFRNIAKAQSPTVVNIRTMARSRGRELTEFFGGQDDLMQRFFGQGQGQGQGQQGRRRQAPDREVPPQEGSGTGFIIDKSGFILTNNHVVEGADDIRVSLYGGGRTESYAAKVIGHDSLTDTALIQLTEMPSGPLQEAKFGDSAQMQPGRLGRGDRQPLQSEPHGHGRRDLGAGPSPRRRAGTRAADAADRRGDQSGQLRRTAAQRPRRGRRHQHGDLHRLAARGQHRYWLRHADQPDSRSAAAAAQRQGHARSHRHRVDRDAITKDVAQALGLPNTGAMLSTVIPGGPADKAGLEPGDVITEFNGRPVADSDALVNMVVGTKPGSSVPVTIYREKAKKTLNVTVDELDLDAEQGRQASSPPRSGVKSRPPPDSAWKSDRSRLRSPASSSCPAAAAAPWSWTSSATARPSIPASARTT